jgi:hypothetical protein
MGIIWIQIHVFTVSDGFQSLECHFFFPVFKDHSLTHLKRLGNNHENMFGCLKMPQTPCSKPLRSYWVNTY